MRELFTCGDGGALVAYLYGEDAPAQRDAVAAHLHGCESCARQVDDLRWTRRSLDAWTVPPAALGFQIAEPPDEAGAMLESATVPAPWWRAPLPAWAQVAAAVLVFGAGLSIGLARDARGVAAPSQAAVDAASRSDLTALEETLRAEVADLRRASAQVTPAPVTESAILRRVEALLAESEARQRREFTLRSVELARDVESQRRVDLASVQESLGQLQGVTGVELRQQREAIQRFNNYLVSVSQQGR